jgi:outer membrane protein assembly factor BamB
VIFPGKSRLARTLALQLSIEEAARLELEGERPREPPAGEEVIGKVKGSMVMKSRMSCVTVLGAIGWLAGVAAAAGGDVAGLLETSGIRGGLCLVIGAKDTTPATALAEKSALDVQLLQPDPKLAARWGADIAVSPLREQVSVRDAAFNPDDYGSDLFNLIVVEDPAALGAATSDGLFRLLVPRGVIACRQMPPAVDAAAKALGASNLTAGAYSCWRKPVRPVEWRIADSLKWRGGPRAQLSSGWGSIAVGDGKFFYRERMEIPGTLDASSAQLFARDEYNGRLLWSVAESNWPAGPRPLAARDGKVYTALGEKLVCLDSATGQVLQELIPKGLGSRWSLGRVSCVEDLLLVSGEIGFRAFSLNDGKEVWRLGGVDNYFVAGSRLVTSSRGRWTARDLHAPTNILWTAETNGHLRLVSDHYFHLNTAEFGPQPQVYHTLRLDNGKLAWSYAPAAFERGKYKLTFSTCEFFGDKFYVMAYHPYADKGQDLWMNRLDIHTGKVEAEDCGPKVADPFNMCGPYFHKAGKYLMYFFGTWVDMTSYERTYRYLAHPSCAIGTVFADGMLFNIPSRKAGALQGISVMAPADIAFNQEPGGKILKKGIGAQAAAQPVAPRADDWPMFRATPARGNAVNTDPGEKPAKLWETPVSLGGRSFGVMSGERTGVTQPVVANGLLVVSDIDGQRIVALNAADGKQKWVYATGGRVDLAPTLYRGLCLFASKDGWVHCLNAADGSLAWKLLVPPRERLIGGHDKLESQWPTICDVLVTNGIGYACCGLSFDHLGGVRAVAFKVESGEVVWSQTYYDEKHSGYGAGPCAGVFTAGPDRSGAPVIAMNSGISIDPATGRILSRNSGVADALHCDTDNFLAGDVSVPRNAEDRGPVGMSDGRIWGKTVAFDRELSVAYANTTAAETWENKGKLNLSAKKAPGKTNLWEKPENEMTVDDIVLTPQRVYCVGHYQRTKKEPELLVLSRDDGKVVHTLPVDAYPVFNGLSAADNRLYLATREGKVICYGKARE